MTYEEAIAIEHEITRMLVANVKEEHKDRVFKAHKLAIESLEKQIPKKPKPIYIDYGEEPVVVSYNCTKCGLEVGVNYADGHKIREHHCHCGQRIDWRGDNV